MKPLDETNIPKQIQDDSEEPLNGSVSVESLYSGALLEIKRLEKRLAYLDGENATLLAEVKYLKHEYTVAKKQANKPAKKCPTHKTALQNLQGAIIKYKEKIKEQEEELFALREKYFKQSKELERLNLQLLKLHNQNPTG